MRSYDYYQCRSQPNGRPINRLHPSLSFHIYCFSLFPCNEVRDRQTINVYCLRDSASDKEYDFRTSNRAVERSIDTEIQDALIFGAMMKYFQISLNNPYHNLPFSLDFSFISCDCLLSE
jgi:hypothetical protein